MKATGSNGQNKVQRLSDDNGTFSFSSRKKTYPVKTKKEKISVNHSSKNKMKTQKQLKVMKVENLLTQKQYKLIKTINEASGKLLQLMDGKISK